MKEKRRETTDGEAHQVRGVKKTRTNPEKLSHRTGFLKSAERMLDALEILSKSRSIRITELARIMKIGISTAHRTLATLVKKGFAVQDTETQRYSLGYMVLQLARSVIHTIEPARYVQPFLDELCRRTERNAAFGVLAPGKDGILILAEKIAEETLIPGPILFQRFPLHSCPCGKVYLATLSDKELTKALPEKALVKFTKYTPSSFTTLKRQIASIRRLGFAVSKDEFIVGLSSMASPVFGAEGTFVGAIAIFGASYKFNSKNVRCWGKLLIGVSEKLKSEFKAKGIN